MATHYRGRHDSQYKAGGSARLKQSGCTPQSLANAIRSATGGRVDLSGDQVFGKVANAEETNPSTAGWSLEDASLAASRIPGSPPLRVSRGPWPDVIAALAGPYMVLLQGDSDQFLSGCSGAFDGAHCIDLHPDLVSGRQWTGDPICADWRTELPSVLQRYAEKLSGTSVRYATLMAQVPLETAPPPDTSTGDPDMGPTLIEGRPIGSAYIPKGARFIPLDGKPEGVFPSERRQEFVSEGYNPQLDKRGIVVGTGDSEFAFVPDGYSDLVWYDLRPNPAPTPPANEITLGPGLYRVP